MVGYPAGGSADIGARILAEKLPALLGQPVVVENRAGTGGQIAARVVKAAPANGAVPPFCWWPTSCRSRSMRRPA